MYNDIVIGDDIIALDDNCVKAGFDPSQYRSIVEGAMGMAVGLHAKEMWGDDGEVPKCPTFSKATWRFGKIECTSDWYQALLTFNIGGEPVTRIVRKTTACQTDARCWNIYQYCWEEMYVEGVKIIVLMPRLLSSGDSSWACPSGFKPTDADPKGQEVKCHTGLCK
jgi:hypothetical protein